MIQLLLHFLARFAIAATLESGCQQLNISDGEFKVLAPAACATLKMPGHFVVKGFEADEFFSLSPVVTNNIFCEMEIDKIERRKGQSFKVVWNSEENFKEIISKTAYANLIRLSKSKSLASKKVCEPFPNFKSIKKINENDLPKSVGELSRGGYMVIPEVASTVFFFNKKFDRIEFSKNVSIDVAVVDALLRPNGELLLITKEYTRMGKVIFCLETWDALSGVKTREDCHIDQTGDQILVEENNKVLRLVQENDKIKAIDFSSKKNRWSVKKPQMFQLTKSFLD